MRRSRFDCSKRALSIVRRSTLSTTNGLVVDIALAARIPAAIPLHIVIAVARIGVEIGAGASNLHGCGAPERETEDADPVAVDNAAPLRVGRERGDHARRDPGCVPTIWVCRPASNRRWLCPDGSDPPRQSLPWPDLSRASSCLEPCRPSRVTRRRAGNARWQKARCLTQASPQRPCCRRPAPARRQAAAGYQTVTERSRPVSGDATLISRVPTSSAACEGTAEAIIGAIGNENVKGLHEGPRRVEKGTRPFANWPAAARP